MNKDVIIKLGKKIKHLREEKNLTQESLALSIDVDKSYIGRIERAERYVNIKVIIKIADVLEVEAKDLFNFDELT